MHPNDIMIVPNTKNDERFADNPLVTNELNVAFYAGVPLTTPDGYPLGSLCVLDNKPNSLTTEQVAALKMLARQAMRLIELHKTNYDLLQSREHLQEVNNELKKFAQIISNDLQMPCDTINELTDIVAEKYADVIDVDGLQILSLIKYSCDNIKVTINDTLKRAEIAQLHQADKSLFSFNSLMQDLAAMLPAPLQNLLAYEQDNSNLFTFKKMILQVLLCFVSNSISYNNQAEKKVAVSYREVAHHYEFVIADNGLGQQVIQRNGVFEIFDTTEEKDKNTFQEYLSNLNYAKQLIQKLNGRIEASFENGKGSRFMFTVAR